MKQFYLSHEFLVHWLLIMITLIVLCHYLDKWSTMLFKYLYDRYLINKVDRECIEYLDGLCKDKLDVLKHESDEHQREERNVKSVSPSNIIEWHNDSLKKFKRNQGNQKNKKPNEN